MALISQSIPKLFNGISQQTAALRLSSQAELQENAYSTVVDGLLKRPPTVHKGKLNVPYSLTNAYTKLVSYSASDRYVIVITNGAIKVFDLDGNEKTVLTPDGTAYLNSAIPNQGFSVVTVADYTFIVNKDKVVAMDATVDPAEPPVAFVWVKTGVQDQTYTVEVGGNTVSYTTGGAADPNSWKTTTIVNSLKTDINALVGYTAVTEGSVIKITKDDSGDFDFKTYDSWGDQAMLGIKGSVQDMKDLPSKFWEGSTITVEGVAEDNNPFDNLYVHWVRGTNTGTWKETVKPGLQNIIDKTTMPHTLINNGDGTFTFKAATWDDRKIGDEELNPEPSFVGNTINDVFFYKNRLGFLSEENVILSRAGAYFNFWSETVSDILDSDPIDVSASNTKVSILIHALPFDESLLLFSHQAQFKLSHDDVVSPSSVSIDVTTQFESSLKSKPVGAGSNLYFVVEKGKYSGVREYYVETEVVSSDAADITAWVPHFIPANVFKLTASSNEDLLLLISSDAPNEIYLYKYYVHNNEKVQQSWSKWVFSTEDTIVGIDIIDTEIVLLVQRSDDAYIEKLDVQSGLIETGMKFQVYLDRKVQLTGVYDLPSDTTTWTLPYATSEAVEVVLTSDWGASTARSLTVQQPTSTTVTAAGDFSGGSVFVGVPYIMRYRFSEQFVKDRQNNPVFTCMLQMKRFILSFVDTGYFRAEVTPRYRDTFKYDYNVEFKGKILGAGSMILGTPVLETGSLTVPVLTNSRDAVVEIINDSYMPCQFQSAEWEAMYVSRNQRL